MNKIFKLAALLSACLMTFACAPEELSTDQYPDDAVNFAAFAPNPVARGGALRIVGSNLQRVVEVQIPGINPITDIEVVKEGHESEIRVIIPVDGPEVGKISIVDLCGNTHVSLADITYSEPIIFDDFSPKNAMPGDVITIKGDYMNNIRAVQFTGGAVVTEFPEQSRYEMKVVVPANAITGKLIIADVDENNNPDGLIPNLFYSQAELVIGEPTVKAADRGTLKAGAEVTVTGEHLEMIQSVNFGGVDVDFTVAEDGKSLTVALPDTAVDGDLVLVSFAGTQHSAGTYATLVPSELKIAPETRYKAGLNAVVTGKDLDLVTSAALAGTALEYVYADGALTFTIPAAAVDGAVTLTLANGKTVDTEAVELVKPVITAVAPLELYAGDEPVIVSGEDLDLVVSATLGGKPAEFKYDETTGQIEVATDVTSVSGKVAFTLANAVVVESAEEVNVKYHSLVIVKSMPAAEHIGAKVTLTGANFMLVENIFVGDAKVQTYFSRTDEEVSFVMPYNKVGSYNIYFDLLNGDREMVATPIEVLLEINYITGWEGNTTITWSDGGRVYVPAAKFDGVKAGAKIRFYYTQKDQTWAQAQINYGDWSGLVFPELSGNTLVPTDIYGWFSDGILDRCTEFTLTKEILDNIQAKKGDSEDQKNVGIIIQGSDLTFTKVEILQEISQEITLWEGELVADDWANQPYALSDAGTELQQAGAQAGQIVNFYVEPIEDAWKLEIVEGHWGPTYMSVCSVGNDTEGGKFTEYDLAANGGKVKLTLTQEILDAAFTQGGWGGTFVLNGDNVKVTKITLL